MQKIGILTKPKSEEVKTVLHKLIRFCKQQNKEVLLLNEHARQLKINKGHTAQDLLNKVDLLIVLGGDGSILHAARVSHNRGIPILGIHLGGVGFLTEATEKNMWKILRKIFGGHYIVDHRLMLEVQVLRAQKKVYQNVCLNEIAINGGIAANRMVHLQVNNNLKPVYEYRGDGILVATPTGSTAYSLSAGGPIIHPQSKVYVITPISPYALSIRPLVCNQNTPTDILVSEIRAGIALTVDGQENFALHEGDIIRIKKARGDALFLRQQNYDYYHVLQEKFSWGN
jgi:NAD+ kinase